VVPAHKAIPAVLADVLRKAPLSPEKVEFAWRAAVGASLARATTVKLDAEGVLHVSANEAHWGREVKRSSQLILARLDGLLGPAVVKSLRTA
jgi:predicted nucleic acid-binding Zn ribbon protein